MITIVTLINRNDERIYRLAESLGNQVDNKFIWMIYDNSPNHDLYILDEIKIRYPKLILQIHQGPMGPFGYVRRDALKLVTTEYNISVDSDDWLSEDFILSFNKIISLGDYDLIINRNHKIMYGDRIVDGRVNTDISKSLITQYSEEKWLIYWWGHAMKTETLFKFVDDFLPLHVYEDYITLFDWTKYAKSIAIAEDGIYYYDRSQPSLSSQSAWIKSVTSLEIAINNLQGSCPHDIGMNKIAASLMYLKHKSLKSNDTEALDKVNTMILKYGLDKYKVPYSCENYYRLKDLVDDEYYNIK
jgi:hypothetical protein